MTQFQGVVDNLFMLRAQIDHCRYVKRIFLITFYDTERVLTVCSVISLYENGVEDET